jgi:hypothetical protein
VLSLSVWTDVVVVWKVQERVFGAALFASSPAFQWAPEPGMRCDSFFKTFFSMCFFLF